MTRSELFKLGYTRQLKIGDKIPTDSYYSPYSERALPTPPEYYNTPYRSGLVDFYARELITKKGNRIICKN